MKKLVAYFSPTGTTEALAKHLAKVIDADLFPIVPEVPYTKADLDWMDKKSRSTVEMNDPTSRPAIAGTCADIRAYDVIFVGFPIWWYTAPTIVRRFLESYDFSGKKIILFATSGGSGFGKTAEDLRRAVKGDAQIVAGKILNGRHSASELKTWIQSCL